MNGFNVMFIKSRDHGATWSAPVKTYGNVSWNDKPTLAVSDNGTDVYISFNGPTGGDPWMAQSHDAGATWSQTKLVDGNYYYFDFDSDVDRRHGHFARRRSSTAAAGTKRPRRARSSVFISVIRATGEPDDRVGLSGDGLRRRRLRRTTSDASRSRPTRTATSSRSTTGRMPRAGCSRSGPSARRRGRTWSSPVTCP
jgi:hypothetical protein